MIRATLLALCAALPLAGFAADGLRDGSHDFDFQAGTWHTHIKRLTKPFSGSADFIELDGIKTVQPVWDGKGSYETLDATGPNGLHMEGMTLFLYNPSAHQWSQIWVSAKNGLLDPPMVGSFKDGRGELVSQDSFNGRTILIRGVWSDINPDSHHFAEYYSDDGGKSWELTFDAELTRVKP